MRRKPAGGKGNLLFLHTRCKTRNPKPFLKRGPAHPSSIAAKRSAGVACTYTPYRCLLVAADAAAALQHSPPTSSTPLLPDRACRCCCHRASARVWHRCHRTRNTPSPTHLATPARSLLTTRVPRRRRTQPSRSQARAYTLLARSTARRVPKEHRRAAGGPGRPRRQGAYARATSAHNNCADVRRQF